MALGEQDDMFWLESHIWIYSSKQTLPGEEGYDNNFYEDINQIKTYYDKYKDQIETVKELWYEGGPQGRRGARGGKARLEYNTKPGKGLFTELFPA